MYFDEMTTAAKAKLLKEILLNANSDQHAIDLIKGFINGTLSINEIYREIYS